jgi:diguanylate cyclase (GGDEF)-like protein
MPESAVTQANPTKLLVVDDDPHAVKIVRDWFAGRAYRILSAENGEQGLTVATSERPDLILLDLTMPGMDGITVARRLREDPAVRSIPIILLTACRDTNSKVEAFAAGADDYVTKPFEFEEMDARVRTMLQRRKRLVSLERTVADLTDSNTELEQLLMVDEKTGLYNAREFQRRLKQEWQRAERYGEPLSLVFFDLDNFKNINDTLGHPAGDQVLRDFASLVTGGARANDIAARYGGEEFAVILPHTDGEMAVRVADRVRSSVADFVFLPDERPLHVTVSCGVATFPESAGVDSVDALIRTADVALYKAKADGKNQVQSAPSAPTS